MKKFVFTAAVLCFVLTIDTFAQSSNATLGGTVADAAGALIPGVTVSAHNVGTGIVANSSRTRVILFHHWTGLELEAPQCAAAYHTRYNPAQTR